MSYRANISFLNSIPRNRKASFQTIYMVGIPFLMSRGSLNCPKILWFTVPAAWSPPLHTVHTMQASSLNLPMIFYFWVYKLSPWLKSFANNWLLPVSPLILFGFKYSFQSKDNNHHELNCTYHTPSFSRKSSFSHILVNLQVFQAESISRKITILLTWSHMQVGKII